MTTAARIKKLADALGRSLDESKKLRERVAELEAIAASLATATFKYDPTVKIAAWDAWQVYVENKKEKKQ